MMVVLKKGVSFSLLTVIFLLILIMIFIGSVYTSHRIKKSYIQVQEAIRVSAICKNSSQTIKDISNNLSKKAQYFVITHATVYAEEYIQERFNNPEREEALAKLYESTRESTNFKTRLKIAMNQSDSLAGIELYAIRLAYEAADITNLPSAISEIEIRPSDVGNTAEERQKIAQGVIFNEGYALYQARVNQNCNDIITEIEADIESNLESKSQKLAKLLHMANLLQAMLIILNMIFFVSLIFMILRPLKNYSSSIKNEEHLNVMGAMELKLLAETYNNVHDYDELTKILNRRGLNVACKNSTKKRSEVCFILVDVDNFKTINDTYGHSTGDFVLEKIAELLKEYFRKEDAIARIGGDEFAVLANNLSFDSSDLITSKIEKLNIELSKVEKVKNVSVSVGIAFSRKGYSKELFRNADKALYRVKNGTKNGYSVYESVIV